MHNVRDQVDELYRLFEEIKSEIRREDEIEYQRWKAGGFLIDEGIYSMYPNLQQVCQSLGLDEEDEEDEEE